MPDPRVSLGHAYTAPKQLLCAHVAHGDKVCHRRRAWCANNEIRAAAVGVQAFGAQFRHAAAASGTNDQRP